MARKKDPYFDLGPEKKTPFFFSDLGFFISAVSILNENPARFLTKAAGVFGVWKSKTLKKQKSMIVLFPRFSFE